MHGGSGAPTIFGGGQLSDTFAPSPCYFLAGYIRLKGGRSQNSDVDYGYGQSGGYQAVPQKPELVALCVQSSYDENGIRRSQLIVPTLLSIQLSYMQFNGKLRAHIFRCQEVFFGIIDDNNAGTIRRC